ncbi:MAG: glycosyltransferase family 1 protein [Chloroflexota bacterium]
MTRSPAVAYVAGWSMQRAPGLARYADELLAALRDVAPAPRIDALTARRSGLARIAWAQTEVPARLARLRPDVCHVTASPAPLAWRGPVVLTVHDLSLLREPASHPRGRARLGAPLLRRSVARAHAVIVPSQATAADARRLLGVPDDRLHVIPEAAATCFRRIEDPEVLARVAARHGVRPGSVLAVGTLEPRKNLERLVEAWVRLRTAGYDGQLVLAGTVGWGAERLLARLADPAIAPDVRRLGRVADADLPALLSMAGAVAYPSRLEGFGLPVVEAIACGAPVVVARGGAPEEVAGDVAIAVDASDVVALAEGLARALEPGPERDRLRSAGPVRAAAFSWDAAARATWRVYEQAAGSAA